MSPMFKEAFIASAVRAGFRGVRNIGHRISQTQAGQRVVNSRPYQMAAGIAGSRPAQFARKHPGKAALGTAIGGMEVANVASRTRQHINPTPITPRGDVSQSTRRMG